MCWKLTKKVLRRRRQESARLDLRVPRSWRRLRAKEREDFPPRQFGALDNNNNNNKGSTNTCTKTRRGGCLHAFLLLALVVCVSHVRLHEQEIASQVRRQERGTLRMSRLETNIEFFEMRTVWTCTHCRPKFSEAPFQQKRQKWKTFCLWERVSLKKHDFHPNTPFLL